MTRRLKFIILTIAFGLVACNGQAPTLTLSPTLAITSTQTLKTSDFECRKKEKECAIATSLGVRLEYIDSFSPDLKWAAIPTFQMAKKPSDQPTGGIRFVKTDKSQEWNFSSTQTSHDLSDCGFFWKIDFWSSDMTCLGKYAQVK